MFIIFRKVKGFVQTDWDWGSHGPLNRRKTWKKERETIRNWS
jgi:hypothetical protein